MIEILAIGAIYLLLKVLTEYAILGKELDKTKNLEDEDE